MTEAIERSDAIRRLAEAQLPLLGPDDRSETLGELAIETSGGFEFITADQPFDVLCAEIKDHAPDDPRFDPLLMEHIARSHRFASNAYLASELKRVTGAETTVTGVEPGHPCPCCGLRTLEEMGAYDICPVCWWEDDGADTRTYANPPPQITVEEMFDRDAGEITQDMLHASGLVPNAVDLMSARINYLEHGISDPARDDLRKYQDPPEKYAQARVFTWDRSSQTLSEPAAGWSGKIRHPPERKP